LNVTTISAPTWSDLEAATKLISPVPGIQQSEIVPDVAFSPSDPRILELWGFDELSQNAAMNVSAFFGGMALISEAIGMIPGKVYKEQKNGDWIYQDDHPVNYMFQTTVNGWQTPCVYKSMKQTHLILGGNGVSAITRNGRGQGVKLKSFLPVNCRFYLQKDGVPKYSLRDAPFVESDDLLMVDGAMASAMYEWYDYDEVLHLKAFGVNGYTGLPVLKVARRSLNLTQTIEEFGQKFFTKGRPAGFLTKDGKLQPKQYEVLREEWKELQEGVRNAFNVGILSGGLKWQAIGYTNDDAQFLQSRQYQVLEIARWLRIPPHMLAELTKATNSNIEQLMLEFITHTLLPWLVRWEEEINLKLFTPKEQSMGFKFFFDVDALLRGDSLTRASVEEKNIRNGTQTVDEIRRGKHLAAYPDGIGEKPLIIASQLGTLESVIDGTCPLQSKGSTEEDSTPTKKTGESSGN